MKKNGIEKLIEFIEKVINSDDTTSYSKHEDAAGRAVFLDHSKRILVAVGVTEISVIRYNDAGDQELNTMVSWEDLTMRQKQKIIDLLESSGDDDSEVNQILLKVFD